MATWNLNDTVDIRSAPNLTWRAGTVTDPDAGPGGGNIEVTLDAPITANDWTGTTRRYGGADNIKNNKVLISKNADLFGMTEGELIRTQGG